MFPFTWVGNEKYLQIQQTYSEFWLQSLLPEMDKCFISIVDLGSKAKGGF
jgi:hypothetical protein